MSSWGVLQFNPTSVIPGRMDNSKQNFIHIDVREELWAGNVGPPEMGERGYIVFRETTPTTLTTLLKEFTGSLPENSS